MLTQDRAKQLFFYNPETGDLVWKQSSERPKVSGKIARHLNADGYLCVMVDGVLLRAHRVIWLYVNGYFPKYDLDLIIGIRNDNRLCNLREATRAQNMQNMHKTMIDHNSGYIGASKYHNKWRARIKINYKEKHIGYYDTPEEAHEAYLQAKRNLHEYGTL